MEVSKLEMNGRGYQSFLEILLSPLKLTTEADLAENKGSER